MPARGLAYQDPSKPRVAQRTLGTIPHKTSYAVGVIQLDCLALFLDGRDLMYWV